MQTNHAIDGALETLRGLLNAFTNPENREQFRKQAVDLLERNQPKLKEDPGADGDPPEYQAPDLAKVIHEGTLLKKGDWRMHKRFCVLDGLYFRIFNDKGELKPKYVIPLIRLTQVRREAQNRFIVTPFPEDGAPILLEGEPAKVSEWLLAFQRAREICFPDDPPPSTEQKKASSAFELQDRFESLLLKVKEQHPIVGLGSMSEDKHSLAYASADLGPALEMRSLPVILAPPDSNHIHRCAVMAFQFPSDATVLKLNLDISSLKRDPTTPVSKGNNTTRVETPLTNDDQQFLQMDPRWALSPRSPSRKQDSLVIEMEPNLLVAKADPEPEVTENSNENLSRREAKAQLAELRRQRKASEITEDEYKVAKRTLLDRLSGAEGEREEAVVNM